MLWLKKLLRWMIVLSLMPLTSGCAAPTSSSYCEVAQPIRWASMADLNATPVDITRQVVRHNDQWAALCKTRS